MVYEITVEEGLIDDFDDTDVNEDQQETIISKVERIAHMDHPHLHMERVYGTSLKKLRCGRFRLFCIIDHNTQVIYMIGYMKREKCYTEKAIATLLTRIREIRF